MSCRSLPTRALCRHHPSRRLRTSRNAYSTVRIRSLPTSCLFAHATALQLHCRQRARVPRRLPRRLAEERGQGRGRKSAMNTHFTVTHLSFGGDGCGVNGDGMLASQRSRHNNAYLLTRLTNTQTMLTLMRGPHPPYQQG